MFDVSVKMGRGGGGGAVRVCSKAADTKVKFAIFFRCK